MRVESIRTHAITTADHDLLAILDAYLPRLAERSIVAITSKIVAICEGRVVPAHAAEKQALVESEGSQLVLVAEVVRTPSDANQLEPALAAVPESIGTVERALADGGYVNADAMERIGQKVDLYVAITREDNSYRRYDYRPPKRSASKKVTDPRLVAMREKVCSDEGQRIYRKRASSVEPVFGVIKAAMGLRQFLLRGLEKVRIEWELACVAYNVKRMWRLAST